MLRSTTTAGLPPLLPPSAVGFIKRRAREFAGLAVIAAAWSLAGALATFSASDPSFNVATGAEAANLLGRPGAHVADICLQTLGVASALLVPAALAWGWRIMAQRRVKHGPARVIALLLALPLTAMALAAFPTSGLWPFATGLGGAAGRMSLDGLTGLLAAYWPAASGWMPAAGAIPFCVALYLYALGLSRGEWAWLAGAFWRSGRAFGETVGLVRAKLAAIPKLFEGAPAPKEETTRRVEPILVEDALPREAEPAPERVDVAKDLVEAPKPKPKKGKKAKAARQKTMDFGVDGEYAVPPMDLLGEAPEPAPEDLISEEQLQENAQMLSQVLEDFGVRGKIVKVRPGPVITLYELEPAPGTKTSRVIGLADDIARSMSATSVRAAVVPGRNVIGIELPNQKRETVYLRELLESESFEKNSGKLTFALGKDIGGAPVNVDLARMPHLLVAGTTGSGKSVAVNTMILSLLYKLSPDQCKFIMIDPKMLELSVYEGIPHLLAPVVTEPGKAVVALKWAVREMEERYRAMSHMGVRNISGYNAKLEKAREAGETLMRTVQTGFDPDTGEPIIEEQPLDMEPLPFIVVIVDEMADLMLVAGKDVEAAIQRLAQMARAAGIHLIMATQRPSVDVITGTIKANFPTRISFQVTTKIDSRTILGEQGAEQLLGMGDMLYMGSGARPMRVHGPFATDEEVEEIVAFLKDQGAPEYVDAVTEDVDDGGSMLDVAGGGNSGDALYDQAVAVVAREGKASTSFIQRHLQIGYNRAARLIERMEQEGVVSKADRVGRREVLVGHHE